jgi:hypothetical protein
MGWGASLGLFTPALSGAKASPTWANVICQVAGHLAANSIFLT